jgi:hypothetical protein
MISKSTKVEDLLGKNIITKDKNIKVILNETKALKKQKDENQLSKELIFVFNNLYNASPVVLELLTSILIKIKKMFYYLMVLQSLKIQLI